MDLIKLNLVTEMDNKGMFDRWGCPKCRFKIRVYSLDRPLICPKCTPPEPIKTVPLGWWSEGNSACPVCRGEAIAVSEGHPIAGLLRLKRDDGKDLFACTAGCTEQIAESKLEGKR